MLTMIPVKSALAQGTTLLMARMPMGKISSGMHLRNRTANLIHRKFSTKKSSHHIVGQAKSSVERNKYAMTTPVSMKWAVLTGVTLVIGTMYLVSRKDSSHGDTGNEINKKKKHSKGRYSAKYEKIKIFKNNWVFFCYSTLPLNALSRLWGQVNSLTLPMWLRPIGFNFYTFLFGVKIDEMVDPDLYHYANLSEFFYRSIKPELRPIAEGNNILTSPSDGKVLQFGIIDSESGEIEQVKGMTYSIKEFLGTHANPSMTRTESSFNLTDQDAKHEEFAKNNNFKVRSNESSDVEDEDRIDDVSTHVINFEIEGDKSLQKYSSSESKTLTLLNELSLNTVLSADEKSEPKNTKLFFAVIYLSPGDYHHYHSPVDWVCNTRRHFPGDLYSVSPYFQRNFPNLFVLNERVSLLGYWKHGFFSMTPVGATNVGSIKLNFDEELVTNVKRKRHSDPKTCYEATYKNASKILGGMPLVKGEEMGGFKLGSTVVLCFEAPSEFKFNISVGDKVMVGQEIGRID
ncbi:hypothetical protein KAFR_0A07460 [Kazachstania africana CBS 2517]|uniref:Phosphatidylserine decarboxylase proenzyme 1, mitochondrial n=1 Tax=Kazachstania africana (strain ATCC 22294 / BCRC 22015 / CBS 2517 / CECT 1963 / NBRC 1671 / NRRL Y-8276) TaxID=1071382 RepID=H2AP80_KAZAF|nr:hypothetical protein KAFR_0A07460 [Kazachstania africana CBS 2517]CCF56180.1 hypothetical protein KAFR_0A07460 [Kazachstania africana CBS 2517]